MGIGRLYGARSSAQRSWKVRARAARRGVAAGMVLVFVVDVVPYGTTAAPLSVSSAGVNRREPIIRPSQLGDTIPGSAGCA